MPQTVLTVPSVAWFTTYNDQAAGLSAWIEQGEGTYGPALHGGYDMDDLPAAAIWIHKLEGRAGVGINITGTQDNYVGGSNYPAIVTAAGAGTQYTAAAAASVTDYLSGWHWGTSSYSDMSFPTGRKAADINGAYAYGYLSMTVNAGAQLGTLANDGCDYRVTWATPGGGLLAAALEILGPAIGSSLLIRDLMRIRHALARGVPGYGRTLLSPLEVARLWHEIRAHRARTYFLPHAVQPAY